MATYFIFGAVGQCPACADHRFSGPAMLAPETSVTYHKCGHACAVKTAVETALASGAVKKLSDHRVVHGSWNRIMDSSATAHIKQREERHG
jgi:predicted secreted Zn-dependent protease